MKGISTVGKINKTKFQLYTLTLKIKNGHETRPAPSNVVQICGTFNGELEFEGHFY